MSTTTGLIWPIKQTFVEYIEGMNDGDVRTDGGARRLEDGSFFFPLRAETPGGQEFGGAVHFTGHYGMLALSIAEPHLEHRPEHILLTIADSDADDGRLAFAEVEDSTDALVPRLTRDGADLFFDNYRAGTALDHIVVRADAPIEHEEV